METLGNLVKKAGFFGSIVFLAGLVMLSIATVTMYQEDVFTSIILLISGAGFILIDVSLREFRAKASFFSGGKVFCGIMMNIAVVLFFIFGWSKQQINADIPIEEHVALLYRSDVALMLFPVFLGIGVIVCFVCAFLDKKKN